MYHHYYLGACLFIINVVHEDFFKCHLSSASWDHKESGKIRHPSLIKLLYFQLAAISWVPPCCHFGGGNDPGNKVGIHFFPENAKNIHCEPFLTLGPQVLNQSGFTKDSRAIKRETCTDCHTEMCFISNLTTT